MGSALSFAETRRVREKLLACSMVAGIPTNDTNKLRMVLRLVEEADDIIVGADLVVDESASQTGVS